MTSWRKEGGSAAMRLEEVPTSISSSNRRIRLVRRDGGIKKTLLPAVWRGRRIQIIELVVRLDENSTFKIDEHMSRRNVVLSLELGEELLGRGADISVRHVLQRFADCCYV